MEKFRQSPTHSMVIFNVKPESKKITKLAFKQRFTTEERLAIRAEAAVNPLVYDFQDLVDSATYIDLERDDTVSSVNTLEQLGLIGAGRSVEVLSNVINEGERWQ